MDWVLTFAGLIILLLAGDALVKGAVNLSLRLGVPALVVSLTIVAFGTSAPELLISVQAILDGVPELALGNVRVEYGEYFDRFRHSSDDRAYAHQPLRYPRQLSANARGNRIVYRPMFYGADHMGQRSDPHRCFGVDLGAYSFGDVQAPCSIV